MAKVSTSEANDLLENVNKLVNPLLIRNKINVFLADMLRGGRMGLYEAYLVHSESLRFERQGVVQPAWNFRCGISCCLAFLNQKLLADVFAERESAEKFKTWALEVYSKNEEKRSHYIADRFSNFLDAKNDPGLLNELIKVRHEYNKLSDDLGPFHIEVFPYHFFSPEELLNESQPIDKCVSEEIEALVVKLSLIES